MKHIVFSDVDGTLFSTQRKVTPLTREAILALQKRGIPFVITSGRSPSGVYPILADYGFNCPLVLYNGALILDEERNVVFHQGIEKPDDRAMVDYLENCGIDLTWCVYSLDQWIVKDSSDPYIKREEEIVRTFTVQGNVDTAEADQISKILCICDPADTDRLEKVMQEAFPRFSIAKSCDKMVEIMAEGVTKATVVHELSKLWDVPLEDIVAFGDNYNDVEMLEAAGKGFIMANASADLLARFPLHSEGDNDHDGIYHTLKKLNMI